MERVAARRQPAHGKVAERPRNTVRRSALRVGAAHDPAEKEADRIADRVMRALRNGSPADDHLARSATRIRRSTAPAGANMPEDDVRVDGSKPSTRIRRSTPPPDAIGAEGGELTDDVAGLVHAAARRGGRPLDPSIRRPMEDAFGTGFGRIRLHEGPDAAGLSDALGARAFTLGRDIFMRQPIDIGRPGDQHLLAHELAHTVQHSGSDSGLAAARTIRRDVGFEFEVGSWTVEYIDQATEDQTSGNAPFTDADIDNRQLSKNTVIHAGRGFNLKPDEADDGSWHMEFVVEPPVPETRKGRSRLERTMKDLRSFNDRLLRKGPSAFLTRANGGARLRTGDLGCTEPWVLLTPRGQIEGEPQLTAGIRLDQLGALMTKMSPGALPGETAAATATRRTGASYMGGKGDNAIVGQSPGQVRNLYGTFPGLTLHSPDRPSEALVSYLAMVRTYLTKAAGTMAYAKSLAPIMARTDFAALFEPVPECRYYKAYPDEFVGLALHVSGMTGQGGQPFFTGASTYSDPTEWAAVQAALTRERWLRDLTRGIDRVTIAHFPDRNVAGYLFGFGSKGTKTDTVGKQGSATETEAPIFELRRMIGHIDHRVWATMALELFDYIVALNRQKSPTFTARKTDRKVANL